MNLQITESCDQADLNEQLSLFSASDVVIDTGDRDSWCTPEWLWRIPLSALGRTEYDLDPCTNEWAKVPATTKVMPPGDGLSHVATLRSFIWMNPPFSNVLPWFDWAMVMANVYRCTVFGVAPLVPGIDAWELFGPKRAFALGRVHFDAPPGIKSSGPSQEHALTMWGDIETQSHENIKALVSKVTKNKYEIVRS